LENRRSTLLWYLIFNKLLQSAAYFLHIIGKINNKSPMKSISVSFVVLSCLLTINGLAQEDKTLNISEPLKVTKITEGIIFDGIPDEATWQSVQPLPMIMFTPVPGHEPSEISVVKIAYDDRYFYVSGIFNYQNLKYLRAVGKQRDYAETSTDRFGIILDTYNDRENAVQFSTNPNGIRYDATIKNDCLVESVDRNSSWNTFWDVKTITGEHGWSVEFRIPFSSLRFQTRDGKTLMGILLTRWSPGKPKPEMVNFPVVSPNYPNAYYKPSLTKVIEFEGLKPDKPVYITPYIIGGLGQVNELNKAGTMWKMNSTPKLDAGGEIKYSITNNLTLDLTFNTDFAQVEADDQMINLTRYSLYFPEKRQFFLEKSDVFDFSFLEGDNLFYSRRIGIHGSNAVRIYGGARITGKIEKWDVGFLNMQTAKFENSPGENYGVIRLRRNVINNYSFIGGMATSRLGMNGTYNIAYGLDGQFRVKEDDYLILRLAQSFEDKADNKLFEMSPTRLLLQWKRRDEIGLSYDFQYTYSGESYDPGIGFERKQSYHGPIATIRYGWLSDSTSFLRNHSLSLSVYNYWNAIAGLHETTNAAMTWSWVTKKFYQGSISTNWFTEDLKNTLILGNNQANVPPGRYSFAYATLLYATSTSHQLSSTISSTAGSFYDGWRLSFTAVPKLKIGTDFDFGLTYYLDYVNFPERDKSFTNHIFGVKGLMTLTNKTSLASFVQYNTAIHRIIANIRFRYNPREGNDFYIVYDEGLNTNRQRITPILPFSTGRTILLKYTYTFRL
jgi:hypothetical protein